MAIGDGMLAQVLLDYFHQHAEEFEQFLLERAGIGEGYVRWRGEETQKRPDSPGFSGRPIVRRC